MAIHIQISQDRDMFLFLIIFGATKKRCMCMLWYYSSYNGEICPTFSFLTLITFSKTSAREGLGSFGGAFVRIQDLQGSPVDLEPVFPPRRDLRNLHTHIERGGPGRCFGKPQ
jgi:hypothetical protein